MALPKQIQDNLFRDVVAKCGCSPLVDDRLDAYASGIKDAIRVFGDRMVVMQTSNDKSDSSKAKVRQSLKLPLDGARVQAAVMVHDVYAGFLAECLDSLVAQTRPFDSILLVDNGDNRETKPIAARYSSVEYRHMDTTNVCDKRNWAAARDDSEFILFVDADNILPPDYLAKMIEVMSDPYVAIVYPSIEYFGQVIMTRFGVPELFDHDELRKENYVENCSLLRRRAFMEAGGWDRDVRTLMDWNLWLRITALGWKAAKADTAIHMRKHGKNMSQLDPDRTESTIQAGMAAKTLTIATPFAGRTWALKRYFKWLDEQSWPHERIQLLFFDNSGNLSFRAKLMEYLSKCDYGGISYVPCSRSFADHLSLSKESGFDADSNQAYADAPQTGRIVTQIAIAYATAYNMNLIKQLVHTDEVLIVEDDVVPPLDAIEKLRHSLHPAEVAAVSGTVRSRFAKRPIALKIKTLLPFVLTDMVRPTNGGVERADAVGFGCLLARVPALQETVFRPWPEAICQPPNQKKRYLGTDYAMCRDWALRGMKINLAWQVDCKHYSADGTWL